MRNFKAGLIIIVMSILMAGCSGDLTTYADQDIASRNEAGLVATNEKVIDKSETGLPSNKDQDYLIEMGEIVYNAIKDEVDVEIVAGYIQATIDSGNVTDLQISQLNKLMECVVADLPPLQADLDKLKLSKPDIYDILIEMDVYVVGPLKSDTSYMMISEICYEDDYKYPSDIVLGVVRPTSLTSTDSGVYQLYLIPQDTTMNIINDSGFAQDDVQVFIEATASQLEEVINFWYGSADYDELQKLVMDYKSFINQIIDDVYFPN